MSAKFSGKITLKLKTFGCMYDRTLCRKGVRSSGGNVGCRLSVQKATTACTVCTGTMKAVALRQECREWLGLPTSAESSGKAQNRSCEHVSLSA